MGTAGNHHVQTLLKQRRCPVCGGDREFEAGEYSGLHAMSIYICGAELMVSNGEIISSRPCKAGSMLAVQQLNQEAAAAAAKAGAA